MAIFTISRVKNLSIAGPCANLKFREARKLDDEWPGSIEAS